MESALYPIHALMRSFTTWEDLSLPEHQRRQQQFFSASENFRYTGSMIRVKKRPTRNIHIATQSSDCSWPPDLLLSISNLHLSQNRRNSHSTLCVVSGKEIVTGKFSGLLDVFGRLYWSVMITCSRGSNLWSSWSLQVFRSPAVRI